MADLTRSVLRDSSSASSTARIAARAAVAAYEDHVATAPLALGNMSSPPTVTTASSYSLANSRYFGYETAANRALYTVSPAKQQIVAGQGLRFKGPPLADLSDSTEGYGTASWMTDAPYQVIQVPNGTVSTTRFLINDRYVSTAGLASGGTSPCYFIIDWSGTRAMRKYTMECQTNDTFYGARVGPIDTIYAPPANRLRLALIGDSYTVGTLSDTAGTQLRQTGLPGWLRDLLGADLIPGGLGSTGMSTPNVKLKFSDPVRTAAIVAQAPDVVYVSGSLNDSGVSAATLQADTLQLLRALRAGLPNTPIIIGGPLAGRLNVSAAMLTVEDGLSAGVTQFADPLTAFVPVMRLASPWLYGTGYQGTTNGSGSSDVLIGPDLTHPTIYGAEVLGRAIAHGIINALRSMRL